MVPLTTSWRRRLFGSNALGTAEGIVTLPSLSKAQQRTERMQASPYREIILELLEFTKMVEKNPMAKLQYDPRNPSPTVLRQAVFARLRSGWI